MPFKLFGKLSFDGSGMQKGLDKAKKGVKGFGDKVKGWMKGVGGAIVGAFALGAIVNKVKETIEWATKVRDLGTAWGISTKEVQEFQYAARQSGIEIEDVMDAMKDLAKSSSEALEFGAEGKLWALKQFGLTVDDIRGKNPTEIFRTLAAAFHDMGGVATPDILKAIEDLMGGAGIKVMNMMRGNLEETIARFGELGLAIDDVTLDKLGEMSDELAYLEDRWAGMWAEATVGAMNFFDKTGNWFSAWHEEGIQFMEDILLWGRPQKGTMTPEGIAEEVVKKQQERAAKIAARKEEREARARKTEQARKERAKAKAERQKEQAASDALAKRKEAAAARLAALEKKRQAWTGFQATNLERIGGQLGMKTTHLNVAQRQLELMIKAEQRNVNAAENVQKIKNEIAP